MSDELNKLKKFAVKGCDYLNEMKIQIQFGRHNINLSTRALSDFVEIHLVDCLIDFFGAENVNHKRSRGYDVELRIPEIIYVNLKCNKDKPTYDAFWAFSHKVQDYLGKKKIADKT